MTVVIQIMDDHFETPITNRGQKRRADTVALFRNDLKGRFDAERVVNIHQRRSELLTQFRLHVVGHDSTARSAFRPEPNKRNSPGRSRSYRKQQQLLEEAVDRTIDRPTWKRQFVPVPEVKP